jgi:hypothetical protein
MKFDNNEWATFFKNLAERMTNENDVSDITLALCRSCELFQKLFIDFCFYKSIKNEIDNIERETTFEKSRPDFIISDEEGKKYLLEVKLYDKNIHNEYKNISEIEKRAFIANYKIPKKGNIYHYNRTWHDFIIYLEKEFSDSKINEPMIFGYIEYIKSVTSYFKGVNMDLSNLISLQTFVEIVKSIIKNDSKTPKKDFNLDGGIIAYEVKYKYKNQGIHFKFGIDFWEGLDEPFINIAISYKDTSKAILNKLEKAKDYGKYYKKDYNYDDREGYTDILFILKKAQFNKLCDNNIDLKEQREILESYYQEIKKLIEK